VLVCRPKSPGFGKRCDAALAIAQRLAQNFLCMLAQQRRRDRVGDRRQFETGAVGTPFARGGRSGNNGLAVMIGLSP